MNFKSFWPVFVKNWWVFWEKLPYFVQVGGLSDRLSVRRTLNRTIGHEKKVLIESFFEIRKTHFDKNGTEQRTFRKNYQAPEKMFQFSLCRFLAKFSIFLPIFETKSPIFTRKSHTEAKSNVNLIFKPWTPWIRVLSNVENQTIGEIKEVSSSTKKIIPSLIDLNHKKKWFLMFRVNILKFQARNWTIIIAPYWVQIKGMRF